VYTCYARARGYLLPVQRSALLAAPPPPRYQSRRDDRTVRPIPVLILAMQFANPAYDSSFADEIPSLVVRQGVRQTQPMSKSNPGAPFTEHGVPGGTQLETNRNTHAYARSAAHIERRRVHRAQPSEPRSLHEKRRSREDDISLFPARSYFKYCA